MRALAVMAVLVIALSPSRLARAQAAPGDNDEARVYDLRLEVDIPLIAASTALSFSWIMSSELAPAYCAPRCDPASVNPIDRPAAGLYDSTLRHVSDIGVATVLTAAAVTLLADAGLPDGIVDVLVVGEACLMTTALSIATNMAVGRPRPLMYGDAAPLDVRMDGNARLSFPSGHTANSFAAAIGTFRTLERRHPHSALPWIVLATGIALASTVGITRVLAGDHFPTDVVVGATVGTSLGLIVPALHARDAHASAQVGPGVAAIEITGVL